MNKPSLGNGYGINRNVAGDRALGVAVPPLAGGVNVKPGQGFSRSNVGMSGKKHFDGAKMHKKNAG